MQVTWRWQQNKFPEIQKQLPKALQEVCLEIAQSVQADAKSTVPVRTGRLRDSITAEEIKDGAVVYTELHYAPVVEYGGHGSPPRPYLTPAAESNTNHPSMGRLEDKL